MTADRRDQLASALYEHYGLPLEALADALLPTVDGMIRQAQAAALEDFGSWLVHSGLAQGYLLGELHVRAAELRVSDDGRDVAQADAP